MGRTSEVVQKTGIVIGFAILCGLIGFFVPMLFDRDVGGALASALLGMAGAAAGVIFGWLVIRRNFG
ncbi:hypothetical protein [Bradyrhizobium sp. G127]|jgi:hypothetical protein|uniref:hypothetical protein n=1 Tax=Bradyrhizobium sp. G127 TaxID=2904800 RepID=UPI001F3EAF31|nr:hypothetical protein [Bradyrhizobium sp. G127]MCF2524949.1 hypothetical protein [Bradyrhizobium sp. G127]